MLSDTNAGQPRPSPIEHMLAALDELQGAMARLAAEKQIARTARRRIARDRLALLEAFSREEPLARTHGEPPGERAAQDPF